MSDIILNVAAKAVLTDNKGRILVLRESSKHATNVKVGRYHLPGGRIDPGESFMDGLRREVREETGLEIEPGTPLFVGEWRPVILGVPHQIVGMYLACKIKGDQTVTVSEEHDDVLWIDPRKRADYDVAEPDWEAIDAHTEMLDT